MPCGIACWFESIWIHLNCWCWQVDFVLHSNNSMFAIYLSKYWSSLFNSFINRIYMFNVHCTYTFITQYAMQLNGHYTDTPHIQCTMFDCSQFINSNIHSNTIRTMRLNARIGQFDGICAMNHIWAIIMLISCNIWF